jgi:hypothetical protein
VDITPAQKFELFDHYRLHTFISILLFSGEQREKCGKFRGSRSTDGRDAREGGIISIIHCSDTSCSRLFILPFIAFVTFVTLFCFADR